MARDRTFRKITKSFIIMSVIRKLNLMSLFSFKAMTLIYHLIDDVISVFENKEVADSFS